MRPGWGRGGKLGVENTASVCPRQREMWTHRGKGLLFPTGSMFLFAWMLVRMANCPETVRRTMCVSMCEQGRRE